MPIFINEVVFKSDIQNTAAAPDISAQAKIPDTPENRVRLIADVTQAVMDKLEREFDRMGER